MDAAGERMFPFQGIVGREPVEDIEGSFEQGFPDQAPVHPFPVLPVEQLHSRFQDALRPFRRIGGRLWRRGSGSTGTARHGEIILTVNPRAS